MIQNICVYCASSSQIDTDYMKAAERSGVLLGQQGLRVVNGAGRNGLMHAVSEAVMTSGGTVTGVIPHFMVANGWKHTSLNECIVTETMHARKQYMIETTDAAIALPGGCGTWEELFELMTWKQLGLCNHPIVILNTKHYYDPLLEMIQRAADGGFMSTHDNRMPSYHVADTPEQAMQALGFNV